MIRSTLISIRHVTIYLNTPALIFLILPFFKPGCLPILAPLMSWVFNVWLVLSSIIILLIYMMHGRWSKIVLAVIAFEFSFFFSTLVNNASLRDCYSLCVRTIALCMLIEIGIDQGTKRLAKAIIIVLGIECTVNGITVFIYPNGMYTTQEFYSHWENWFLGFRNMHILYVLPLLCMFWIYALYKNLSRARILLGVLFFALPMYFSWSATGVVGVSLFLILFVFSEVRILTKLLEIKKYVVIVLVGFFGFVIFRVQYIFEPLITRVLKRNLTFTGRTIVWDRALEYFNGHWLIGSGINTLEVNASILNAPHTHNYLLQILYQAGLIGMTGFVVIIMLLVRRLARANSKKYRYIVSATLFSFFVMLLAESYSNEMAIFYGIVTMGYNIDKLSNGLTRKRCEVT